MTPDYVCNPALFFTDFAEVAAEHFPVAVCNTPNLYFAPLV